MGLSLLRSQPVSERVIDNRGAVGETEMSE